MPYYNSRKVHVKFNKPYLLNSENKLEIIANIFKMFNSKHQIDVSKIDLIHSPNSNSVLIADNISSMFSFKNLK